MTIYRSRRKSQSWAGETIGILVLDCSYPFIPGNVANATTYDFPVRFAVVDGATNSRLIYDADESLIAPYEAAARQLESEGVMAITGACGFMALLQGHIAAAVDVPVFLSSLLQVPLMHQITGKRVGIICADKSKLTQEHFGAVGVAPDTPLALAGMEEMPAFTQAVFQPDGLWDDEAIRAEVIEAAEQLVGTNGDIGSILLECSDLPPYATDVQRATGLPVFDFTTMIDYVHSSLARTRFSGVV